MDIVSYGISNKSSLLENITRKDILGIGVEGSYSSMKERIDAIESSFRKASEKVDRMIVQDAINIMKAHSKLNIVAQASKYRMYNMIFDDLFDLSGIDLDKSTGYSHKPNIGVIESNEGCTVETVGEYCEFPPDKAIFSIDAIGRSSELSIIPVMSSNESQGHIAKASSVFGRDWDAWRAFDGLKTLNGGNGNNRWASASSGMPAWLQIKLPEKKIIRSYGVTSNPRTETMLGSQSRQNVKSWEFLGSNDEVNWTVLHQVKDERQWQKNETRFYNIDLPGSFLYYRLNVIEVFEGSLVSIGELELFDNTPGSSLGNYFISQDNGQSWDPIIPETLFYFDKDILPEYKIKIKAELPNGVQLHNYALTWA